MLKLKISIFLIVLMISACNAQNAKQANIKEVFTSEKGNFKVVFPAIPKEEIKEAGNGSVKIQNFWFSVSQSQKSFVVSYVDFPNVPEMSEALLKINYDNLRDATAKQINSTLKNERDVWVDGKLGREFTLTNSKGIKVKYRVYWNEKRFYQLIASMEPEIAEDKQANEEVDKFLNSFHLLNK